MKKKINKKYPIVLRIKTSYLKNSKEKTSIKTKKVIKMYWNL